MESSRRGASPRQAAARRVRGRLRFKHLELLAKLGEVANLHAASETLSMTQSAASKLLREIEDIFGARLFERSRTGLAANPAGVALVAHARLLLGLVDHASEDLDAIGSGATGLVRIGVTAVAAPVLLPRAVKALRRTHPGIIVSVQEGGPELVAELRSGNLDFVLGRFNADDSGPGLAIERLYEEPIVAVVRPEHPLLRLLRPLKWPQTVGFDWVFPPRGAPMRTALRAWFARHDLAIPFSTFESVSVMANITWVRESDAISILPAGVASHYAALGLVKVLPLALDLAQPPVVLLHRRTPPFTGAAAAAADAIRQVAQDTLGAASPQRTGT